MNKKEIEVLENEIEQLIDNDSDLYSKKQCIESIPGVGKVLSWMIIAKTEGFTKINNPRKLACYAGVVPFGYQSGTSIKFKPKLSYYTDKSLKTVLHIGCNESCEVRK